MKHLALAVLAIVAVLFFQPFAFAPLMADCPEVQHIDDPPCVPDPPPPSCVVRGEAIITNAIFATSMQAYTFANHHDTIAIISTPEPAPRYIVFFNSAPICLPPAVWFTITDDALTAFAVYASRPESVKGVFSVGDTAWYVWWTN